MKLARAVVQESSRKVGSSGCTWGALYQDNFYPFSFAKNDPSISDVFEECKRVQANLASSGTIGIVPVPVSKVRFTAPYQRSRSTVFAIGKNYLEHVNEVDSSNLMKNISKPTAPENPIVFTKLPTSVIGPDEFIEYPTGISTELDYEGELGVVIGKEGKSIKENDALDYIFGFTIVNDVTARDLQRKHQQWLLGKSLDTFCPIGPHIVPKESVLDLNGELQLGLTTHVNGELRQSGNTKDLLFSVPRLIATISEGIKLHPGDVIATGTPKGVGAGFSPPKFLVPGDKVEIEIERIGKLTNTVQ
mmetsp:Transcript_2447/g.2841  ORF Transcript_2447/g.2841 Transcript_2447/m.2841 type:complete len:304 (+) Transcript_2447:118-1029(+)